MACRMGPRVAVLIPLLVVAVWVSGCAKVVSGDARPVPGRADGCDALVVMLLDVSLSMQATDVAPRRLTVAQQASKSFLRKLPGDTLLGLVTFAGTASVQETPKVDRTGVERAIDLVWLEERTATGAGIYAALDSMKSAAPDGKQLRPARIVLLSDGKQTVPAGLDQPQGAYLAAREANRQNVHVSTIALGTDQGEVEIHSDAGKIDRVKVPVEHPSLHEIARLSGGTFHTATSLEELNKAFDELACRR